MKCCPADVSHRDYVDCGHVKDLFQWLYLGLDIIVSLLCWYSSIAACFGNEIYPELLLFHDTHRLREAFESYFNGAGEAVLPASSARRLEVICEV